MRSKAGLPPSVATEMGELRARLEEAEETLRAIRSGEVDALYVGDQVYSIDGADSASNRFRGVVLEQVMDAVIAIDNERRVTYLNPAAECLYCVRSADVLGRRLEEVCSFAWLTPATQPVIAAAVSQTGQWHHDGIHVLPQGREIYLECVVSALTGVAMEQIGMLVVSRDVSLRRRAEQAVHEAGRRKDEFLAMLSHELRNPLAPILTAADLLERSGNPDKAVVAAGRIIGRQARHLNDLVSDLLDVARITTGKITLKKSDCEIGQVVSHAIEQTRALIESKRHKLNVELPVTPIYVHGDVSRLTQVVCNLLNNAAKYTEPDGVIDLGVTLHGGEVCVTVSDNGMGILPDVLPHIFDLFTQSWRSLDRAEGGLGVGLTLAKRLVEMHDGHVTVRSDGPGTGSRFDVYLPWVPTDAITPVRTGREPRAGPVNTRRILIVDDNLDAAETLSLFLQLHGHAIATVNDGLQVMSRAREFRPQVVLLDLGLPGLSGLEIASQLRASDDLRHVKLVALTGYGQEEDRRKTRAHGFDYHLVKPVDLDELGDIVRQ
jgi:PAS domain S-box-containing protein